MEDESANRRGEPGGEESAWKCWELPKYQLGMRQKWGPRCPKKRRRRIAVFVFGVPVSQPEKGTLNTHTHKPLWLACEEVSSGWLFLAQKSTNQQANGGFVLAPTSHGSGEGASGRLGRLHLIGVLSTLMVEVNEGNGTPGLCPKWSDSPLHPEKPLPFQ